MKIDVKEATVETDIDFGDSIAMGVSDDPDAIIHIMSLLTNLYNDPELAVIRETVTNGWDAMTEAGNTAPVEVYLPTKDNPLFVVKDTGVGMSVYDIKKIYSKYGASTKRTSDALIGAMGLGCKSPLTIATQFTLSSIKDGMKTIVIISKTESGINAVNVVSSRPTQEPNGVTVTIPVPDVYSFNQKAETFFKYSPKEKTKVNGRHPETVLDDATKVNLQNDVEFELFTTKSQSYWSGGSMKVIMGGVAYNITEEEIERSNERNKTDARFGSLKTNLYAVVPIGYVNLTPSREGLRYTDKTNAAIDEILRVFYADILAHAQETLDAVEDRAEVYKVYSEWSNIFDGLFKRGEVTWKGEVVKWSVDAGPYTSFPYVHKYAGNAADYRHMSSMDLTRENTFIIYGTNPSNTRKYSGHYGPFLNARNLNTASFYFFDTKHNKALKGPWVKSNKNLTFMHIKEFLSIVKEYKKEERAKLKSTTPVNPRGKATYQVLDLIKGTAEEVVYTDIPAGTPYVHADHFTGYFAKYLQAMYNEITYSYDYNSPGYSMKYAKAIRTLTNHEKVILVGAKRKHTTVENRVKGSYNLRDELRAASKVEGMSRVIKMYSLQDDSYLSTFIDLLKSADMHLELLEPEIRAYYNPTRKEKMIFDKIKETTDAGMTLGISGRNAPWSAIRRTQEKFSEYMNGKYCFYSVMLSHVNRTGDKKALREMVEYMNGVHLKSLTEQD